MRTARITAVAAIAATALYAEDFSLTANGVGPIKVHTTLTYEGKGERLVADATNDSGVSIPYVKLCVAADTKGCLFEMWTTEAWEAGKTLNWDVTSQRHVPNLSHQVSIAAINAPALAPPPLPQGAPPAEKAKPVESIAPPPTPVSKKVEPEVLTNDAVVKLAKAGLGDDIIISMINSQPGQYTTIADSIILLKQSGVSDKVIAAILARASAAPASNSAAETPGLHTTVNARPTLAFTGEPLVLHDATPVRLRLSRNLSSADAKTGDTVDFEVLDDVEVDGLVVIKRGSVAIGTITDAEKNGRCAEGDSPVDCKTVRNGAFHQATFRLHGRGGGTCQPCCTEKGYPKCGLHLDSHAPIVLGIREIPGAHGDDTHSGCAPGSALFDSASGMKLTLGPDSVNWRARNCGVSTAVQIPLRLGAIAATHTNKPARYEQISVGGSVPAGWPISATFQNDAQAGPERGNRRSDRLPYDA